MNLCAPEKNDSDLIYDLKFPLCKSDKTYV